MLGYLRGQVLDNGVQSGDGKLVVGVGSEAQGFVGYSVNVPRTVDYELLPNGKTIELFIYTHVREDSLDLYGFSTKAEKELFLTLLSVNGIGPKGALSILSGCDPTQLVQAVIEGDKDLLTKIPGIGKKTAERVVLELADPLRKKMEAGLFGNATATARAKAPAGATAHATAPRSQAVKDAVSALVGLGYREAEANSLVNRLLTADEDLIAWKTEDLIKMALRQLA